MASHDTIYALSSGAGLAGVAVVRISGPKSAGIVSSLCGALPRPRRATLRSIRAPEDGRPIDTGLVLWFPGPKSFTGEDTAELHLHGGHAVVRAVFAALETMSDVRAAGPGEFTKRAFVNGKMDLLEAEGIADLIEARSERQHRMALHRAQGGLEGILEDWKRQVIELLARLEATIDFIDEAHVAETSLADAGGRIDRLVQAIDRELARAEQGRRLRDGLTVVLAGPPNAGKSSLLNALARKNAAIVSPIPGTTRDVVEVHLILAGLPVTLRDTAGLRERTSDPLEELGMARSRHAMEEADLVLWLNSPDTDLDAERGSLDSDAIWIWSKADLARWQGAVDPPPLEVSAVTGQGVDALERAIAQGLEARVADADGALVTRARHRDCLVEMRGHLASARIRGGDALELQTEDVRQAARAMARLTGAVEVESVLDSIFREFCIGK